MSTGDCDARCLVLMMDFSTRSLLILRAAAVALLATLGATCKPSASYMMMTLTFSSNFVLDYSIPNNTSFETTVIVADPDSNYSLDLDPN